MVGFSPYLRKESDFNYFKKLWSPNEWNNWNPALGGSQPTESRDSNNWRNWNNWNRPYFNYFKSWGAQILEMIVIGAVSIISVVEMVGISPYRRRESHFNYFKSGGHQIIEIIETRSSVVPNPPNPGISIFQINWNTWNRPYFNSFNYFKCWGAQIIEIGVNSIISTISSVSIIEMAGFSPSPRKESDFNYFNYFKCCGHQIIEIIEIRSSVVPNPPNPGISIIEIIEIIEIGVISIISIIEMVGFSPNPRKESDFNYFNKCGHQIIEKKKSGLRWFPTHRIPGFQYLKQLK